MVKNSSSIVFKTPMLPFSTVLNSCSPMTSLHYVVLCVSNELGGIEWI